MSDKPLKILLIEDNPGDIRLIHEMLDDIGGTQFNLVSVDRLSTGLEYLSRGRIDVVLLDLSLPDSLGLDTFSRAYAQASDIPIVVLTVLDDEDLAIEAVHAGAQDYLVKVRIDGYSLARSIRYAIERKRKEEMLRDEVSSLKEHLLRDQLEHEAAFSSIITKSRKMRPIFQYIEVIAGSPQPVLITGETGVGKELIAMVLHDLSDRKGKFIAVNVAGLDDVIFSDTLFGHKKGAFTGAEQARDGLISQAHDGTLFLDEIGDLHESSQVKLLRLLQDGKYYPLGSDIPIKSDVRIIVSTNRDIHSLILIEKFRKDLYYRLRTHQIHIPPLKERMEDIPLLVDHFLNEAAKSLQKKKPSYPPELLTLLLTYDFPGNVREFQAMIFDAVAQHKSGILSMESFKKIIKHEKTSANSHSPVLEDNIQLLPFTSGHFPTLKEAEDYLISEALKRTGGNQGIAASLLGITRQALNRRLNRNKINNDY